MTDQPVRTRIAPSPTGDPHVGTAFMALFNYAFARRHGGQFLLRIEDTDRARSKPEYEQVIFDAVRWCGLDWDEGPDVGGPHGPYRQSERQPTGIYREAAERLIEGGRAYYCFQTPAQVDAVKAQLPSDKKYRSPDRDLDPAEARRRAEGGEPHCVRLRVPQGAITVADRLRKPTEIDLDGVDDQVLIKAKDGFPTYHLAVVVDDHAMGVSHIIRGEEWLASMPKHLLLYEGLGWDMPPTYHLPLLRNPDKDKTKLSKRKNPTSILYYRDRGYLPEALLNFLGLMAYSPGQGDEKVALDAFVDGFDIDKISLGSPIWDLAKLDNLNQRYLREDHTPEQLFERLKGWLWDDDYLVRAVAPAQARLTTLADFAPLVAPLLSEVCADALTAEALTPKGKDARQTLDLVWGFLYLLERGGDFGADAARAVAEDVVARREGTKIRQVTHPLFVALTGSAVALPLYETIALLGKDRVRVRLRAAFAPLNGGKELGKKAIGKLEKAWR
jgi:glutamyl-tRNA synthetase